MATEQSMIIPEENIKCPFCNQNDFDLIGLKYHIEHHCEIYAELDISTCGVYS